MVYLAMYLRGEAGRDSHFASAVPLPPAIPTNIIPLDVVICGWPAAVVVAYGWVLPEFQGGFPCCCFLLRSSCDRDMWVLRLLPPSPVCCCCWDERVISRRGIDIDPPL